MKRGTNRAEREKAGEHLPGFAVKNNRAELVDPEKVISDWLR